MVTNVEEVGLFSRLGGALKGILVGGLLSVISVPLLFWNEGRAVKTAKGLKEGSSLVVDIQPDSIDSGNDGKFVHSVGDVSTDDVLRDDRFDLEYNGVRLTRHVEMFQWKEDQDTRTEKKLGGGERRITTYSYSKAWSPGVIDSSRFEEAASHQNPTDSLFRDRSQQAKNVSLGKFTLPSSLIGMIRGSEGVKLTGENLPGDLPFAVQIRGDGPAGSSRVYISRSKNRPAKAKPASANPPSGDKSDDESSSSPAKPDWPELIDLDAGKKEPGKKGPEPVESAPQMQTAGAPQIGDVRVWFTATPVAKVSLLSRQSGTTFQPFETSFGTTIHVLREGTYTAAEMIAQEEAANRMLTWVLRGLGTLLMFFGFSLILKPLVVLADVVPIFGSLVGVGTSIVAGLLTIAGALTVIAVAWVFYRPLLGITLLAIAAGALYMLYKRGKNKRVQPETLTEMDLV